MPVMGRSLCRDIKNRQQRLTEVSVSCSGGSSPTVSGLDAAFVRSVERSAEGTYKITFKDTAVRSLQVKKLFAATLRLAYAFAVDKNSVTVKTQTLVAISAVAATAVKGDLTFTADTAGTAGNAITVTYTSGATAGSEVVSVVGNAISVQIAAGVSTATQVKAALDGDAGAAALINTSISGTAGAGQAVGTPAALAGGTAAFSAGDAKDAAFDVGILWHGAARVF